VIVNTQIQICEQSDDSTRLPTTGIVMHRIKALLGHKVMKLLRGSAILLSGRLAGALCAYVLQVVLARSIGGAELGNYVRAFSWCVVLANLSLLGLDSAAIRFVGMGMATGDQGRIGGFIRRSRQIVLVVSLLIVSLAASLVVLLGDHVSDSRPLLIAILCVPLLALIRLNVRITQAFSWFTLSVLPNTVLRPGLLLAAVLAGWKFQLISSATGIMLLQLCVMLLIAFGQNAVLSFRITDQIGQSLPVYESRRWLRTALPLLLTSTFTLFYAELNIIVLGAVLPAEELAVFSVAYRTALLILFALVAVDGVTMPAASRLHTEKNSPELRREIARATRLKFWLSLTAMLGLAVLGKPVLSIFGPEFTSGYRVLIILAAAQVARAAIGPAGELLSVTGHQDRCVVISAASLIVTVVFHLAFASSWGIEGAAITILLVTVVSNLWLRRRVMEHLDLDPSILGLRRAANEKPYVQALQTVKLS